MLKNPFFHPGSTAGASGVSDNTGDAAMGLIGAHEL